MSYHTAWFSEYDSYNQNPIEGGRGAEETWLSFKINSFPTDYPGISLLIIPLFFNLNITYPENS